MEQIISPHVHAEVTADLASIPFRTPVVDNDHSVYERKFLETEGRYSRRIDEHQRSNEEANANLDHDWLVLTEDIRQQVIDNPSVRKVLVKYVSEPLGEDIPRQAIGELSAQDERLAKTTVGLQGTVGSLLDLETVPDEVIKPDIYHTDPLMTPDNAYDELARTKSSYPDRYEEVLANLRERVVNSPGTTGLEKRLIARRYRFARDIKMLSLMAELQDNLPENPEIDSDLVTHELPSGTKMVMTAEAFEASPELLDPSKWESRRQIKDRVYTITVDGKPYIMKERKTSRHTDVLKNGHQDGVNSAEEFATAREFAERGRIETDEIIVRWENPVGYVEFPDGYQFSVFESEPDLGNTMPVYKLTDAIKAAPNEYAEEFEQLRSQAQEILNNKLDNIPIHLRPDASGNFPDLTYEEFAEIKANFMESYAKELLSNRTNELGYTNRDMDGFAFIVHTEPKPKLEIIGFDFEYYRRDPDSAQQQIDRIAERNENGERAKHWNYYVSQMSPAAKAASYAMMEEIGIKMPKPE